MAESVDDNCRCWNEGQWGRVHREGCPVHDPNYEPPPCRIQGPSFPPGDFKPLCLLPEGHTGEHDFASRLALRNRLRAENRHCPDDGTCHHDCAELYGGACWRVFNAEPLSDVFVRDEWPDLIRQAEQISLVIAPGVDEIPEPDTQSMYVEIHVTAGPEWSSAHSHRSMKLRVRAITEERDPAQAATYSIVAAFREAADRLEQMTSGPPVADTTTARMMAEDGTFKP